MKTSERHRTSPEGQAQLLTVRQVAAWLNLGRSTVYELIAQRELPAFKVGGRVRIPVTAVHSLLKKTKL